MNTVLINLVQRIKEPQKWAGQYAPFAYRELIIVNLKKVIENDQNRDKQFTLKLQELTMDQYESLDNEAQFQLISNNILLGNKQALVIFRNEILQTTKKDNTSVYLNAIKQWPACYQGDLMELVWPVLQ